MKIWIRRMIPQLDFILLGLFPWFRHPNLLILIIHLIYTAAFTGNSILILLIWLDSHLHTHVLPIVSSPHWPGLHFLHSPQNGYQLFHRKKNISYFYLCYSALLFLTLGLAECILLTLMAYDKLCGCLQPPAVHSPHEPQHLSTDGCCNLDWWSPCSPCTHHLSHELPHLWFQRLIITSVRCLPSWCLVWTYQPMRWWNLCSTIVFLLIPFILHSNFLHSHLPHCSQDELSQGQEQALATCSSHMTVVSLYWSSYLHLHDTHLSPYTWTRPDWSCSWHHGDPHAQPTHLQPEEWEIGWGSEEVHGKVLQLEEISYSTMSLSEMLYCQY